MFPDIKNLSWLEYNTLAYTLKTHSAKLLLQEFDADTGLAKKIARVIDWPKIMLGSQLPAANEAKTILGYLGLAIKLYLTGEVKRGEYTGFFNYKPNETSQPETLPLASQFQLQHGIHYRIKAADEHILPLRNLPRAVRKFLTDLNAYQDKTTILLELTADTAFAEIKFHINARKELLVIGMSGIEFRDHLFNLLNKHPQLLQQGLQQLKGQSMLQKSNLELIADLKEQSQTIQALLHNLSFQYGTARLYKFIKTTWEELQAIKEEQYRITEQLSLLQTLQIKVELSNATSTTLNSLLEQQSQDLKLAQQTTEIWLNYMQSDLKTANWQLDGLITELANNNTLLNRAYNLKAKIAACSGKKQESLMYYKKASTLLPNDVITCNNYAALLTDLGRAQQDISLYREAYSYYQKVELNQLPPEQLPIVASGMAYNYLLLAAYDPNSSQLQTQAKALLEKAIKYNPNYLNAHLFFAILHYDQASYSLALQAIENALSLQANHSTALMRKGFILEKLDNPTDALIYLNQAKELLSNSTTINASWIKGVLAIVCQGKSN